VVIQLSHKISLNMSVECVNTPSVNNNIIKYIKNNDGDYVCPHNGCGKITMKQNTMYYHIMKNHSTRLPFQCNRCNDTPQFLQRSGYLNHLATKHANDTKLTDKEKEMLGGLKENPVVGVSFKCPHEGCGQVTKAKSNMLIHYARTHAAEWIPSYVRGEACVGCQEHFSSSSAYLYHSITCFEQMASTDQLNIISRIK